MVATPDIVNNSSWYPDSGATNHVTWDLNNLSYGSPYHGNKRIYMGNGVGLNITHIGHSSVSSTSDNSRSLLLKNLLHVPLITKNLISVSQFVADNFVYFEFHPHICFVKNQTTNQVLLEGDLHNGLYRFNLQKHNQHTGSNKVLLPKSVIAATQEQSAKILSTKISSNSFDLWHKRLGHPSFKTVIRVLKHFNIQLVN